MSSFFRKLLWITRRPTKEEELQEEIQFHLDEEIEERRARGLPDPEAKRAAHRELGNITLLKEDTRESWTWTFAEQLLKDVRFGLHMLRRSPSFTTVAVVTLALAIGANAVVFGVMNALILRPLHLPHAESLYQIENAVNYQGQMSYPDYRDMRERNRSFEDLAAYSITRAGLDTGENTSRAWVSASSENYFDVLGVQPYLGRFFHTSDEHGPASVPYIVFSYAYWHSHFQDNPAVVGRVVQVNKYPFTVIGVAPPGFKGPLLPFAPDFFLPMVNYDQISGTNVLNVRASRWVFATLGHLKAGVTPEQASADLNAVGANLETIYPKEHAHAVYSLARPSLYGDYVGRPMQAFVGGLMLLATLILLAACANLGSLFAARAADRSREIALRLALGAGRVRILRQLFTEAFLVSLMGGAAGLSAGLMLLRALSLWQPFPQFPIVIPVTPDARVYLVALLLTIASGLLFGAAPVRQVLRTDPYAIVKGGNTTINRRITLRDLLLVTQIAICAVLVTSSMVAFRGLGRSLHSNFGFEPANAMLVAVDLDMAGYRGDAVPAVHKRIIDAVQTIPGVSSVGLIDLPPLNNGGGATSMIFSDETTDLSPPAAVATAITFRISPDYFRAAGTALTSGRDFTWHDNAEAPHVAVINQDFARRVFGSAASAIGGHFKTRDGDRLQVAGIVEDGKYIGLTERQQAAFFVPMLQASTTDTWVVLRSNSDPQQLAAAIKGKLRDLDAGLPSFIQTWNEALEFVLFPSRVATVALGVLGVMGAMLAITGIFGVATYSVSKRMRELGIRVALGAKRKQVVQAALERPFKLLAFGSAAGLLLGILAGRVLALIVYDATPRDPLVLAGVVFAMLLLGLLATWIPAQRALSIDPLRLLREE